MKKSTKLSLFLVLFAYLLFSLHACNTPKKESKADEEVVIPKTGLPVLIVVALGPGG